MLDVRALIADVLTLDLKQIDGDLNAKTCSAWNSIAHLQLMQSLEQALGIKLEFSQMVKLTSLSAIETLVREQHESIR